MHLRGIHTLVMNGCRRATITGASFSSLLGIHALVMRDCSEEQHAAAYSLGLPVILSVDFRFERISAPTY